uniref:hypothetical protein n=1 Tax=Amycolatopsis sp. CA-096443 TaxID=3239919 RepID=UPI003F4992B0
MPDTMSLAEHARQVRSQLGAFWMRVNAAVDDAPPTAAEKEEVQRELAEIARIPWDIAESLGGAPDETLSEAAREARAGMLARLGLEDDAVPSDPRESVIANAVVD